MKNEIIESELIRLMLEGRINKLGTGLKVADFPSPYNSPAYKHTHLNTAVWYYKNGIELLLFEEELIGIKLNLSDIEIRRDKKQMSYGFHTKRGRTLARIFSALMEKGTDFEIDKDRSNEQTMVIRLLPSKSCIQIHLPSDSMWAVTFSNTGS